MVLSYFTEKGAKDILLSYQNLIGGEFYINEDKSIKVKLNDILIAKSIVIGCYQVVFLLENNYVSVKEFTQINKIPYFFESYDIKEVKY
jgi:hypothetical protein